MALISSVFSCFFGKHEKPAVRGRTRGSRDKKPGAACRPGSWRSFGKYLFLEDSRYTSQAKNRAAIKRDVCKYRALTCCHIRRAGVMHGQKSFSEIFRY